MKHTNDPRPRPRISVKDRSSSRPALNEQGIRWARIVAKPLEHRTNSELAVQEGAALGDAFPAQRAETVAEIVSGRPSMDGAVVIIAVTDEAGRFRFASAIADPETYFGGAP